MQKRKDKNEVVPLLLKKPSLCRRLANLGRVTMVSGHGVTCQAMLLTAIQSAAATDVAPEPLGVDVVEQVLHAVPPRSITGMRPRESPVI
jgi:hypothetical protein